MDDPAMERALAIVRGGGSFEQACESTGVPLDQLTTRYYSVHEPDRPFPDNDDNDDDDTRS